MSLTADAFSSLIHDAHIRDDEGASFVVTFTSRKTGSVVAVRFTRAIGILGVGASGYWVGINFGQGFESVGSYTSAEPLRGWHFATNKKWSATASDEKKAIAAWFTLNFNRCGLERIGRATTIKLAA